MLDLNPFDQFDSQETAPPAAAIPSTAPDPSKAANPFDQFDTPDAVATNGDQAEAPIHFKSWADVQEFRQKFHPDKADLSDQQFVDWFGKSRGSPLPVVVGDRTWKDYAGLGARAVGKGFDDLGGLVSQGDVGMRVEREALKGLGLDTSTLLDKFGLPKPATDNEKLASSAIEGAAAAGPFALAGAPAVATLASGAASGAAGEGARQAGYGPVTQFAASVLAGAPFALAPAVARTATVPLRYLANSMGELGAETRAARILQEGASRPIEDVTADIANRSTPVPGSEPTLAEVAGDPGLAGIQRGHANTAPPNFAAAMAERHQANAIARTRAASEAMGDGSPQAIQDYAGGEMATAERATAEQQAARQAAMDARLAGGQEAATAARTDAETGLSSGVEAIGQTADRDVTGGAARDIYDPAYQAAKQKSRDAYAAPELNDRTPIVVPRAMFVRLRDALDDFYGDGGGEVPAPLKAVLTDLADEHTTIRTLTNVDRRLADFAGEARNAGRNAESAFAERVRHDLSDVVQKNATPEYVAALKNAKKVRAEQGRVFETGDVAAAFARDRYGNPTVGNNALPSRLVRPGPAGGDTVDRLIEAVGPANAEAIVRQELRRVVEEKGVETAAQARALSVRYGEVARRFPDVQADLQKIEQLAATREGAVGAETAATTAKPTPEEAASIKERAALHDEILASPLSRVAGADVEPSAFVTSLLRRADNGRQMGFLIRRTRGNAPAAAGVRRALGDYIVEAGKGPNVTAAGENIPSIQGTRKAIATVTSRAGEALTPQQKIVLKRVNRELESANFAATAAKPAGSETAMNKTFTEFVEMAPGVPNGTGSVLRKVLSLMDSGDRVQELLTQAVLDPDFAATLLKRPTEKHWAEIKAGMEKGRKSLAASTASHPIPANDLGLPARLHGSVGQSAVAADDKRDRQRKARSSVPGRSGQ